jgi:hypothetical protein
MPTCNWLVVRFTTGGYGVGRRDDAAGIYYYSEAPGSGPKTFAEAEEARSLADTLNGRPALPRRMTEDRFDEAIGHVNLTIEMKRALRAILVDGSTWRAAAERHGVTESGILRAMRRVAAQNQPA